MNRHSGLNYCLPGGSGSEGRLSITGNRGQMSVLPEKLNNLSWTGGSTGSKPCGQIVHNNQVARINHLRLLCEVSDALGDPPPLDFEALLVPTYWIIGDEDRATALQCSFLRH